MSKKKAFSLKTKLVLSLSAIAIMLLASGLISFLEYQRMNSRVSVQVSESIEQLNLTESLYSMCVIYNMEVLKVVGDEEITVLPKFDTPVFIEKAMKLPNYQKIADALTNYINTANDLEDVLLSDFIDSRAWYFDELQPDYEALVATIGEAGNKTYKDLAEYSQTYDTGLNRSVIPMIVAVGGGLLLVLMLMFFLLSFYVNPLYNMLEGLKNYRAYNKKYTYDFDGDDQLRELNSGISDMIAENQQMRKRISSVKNPESKPEDEL